MIRLRFIFGIILSFIFFSNCSENKFESFYLTEISNDTSLVEFLNMVENFEDYLLRNKFVEKIDKENYLELTEKAFKDEIVLQADSNFYNEVDAWLFMENFSFAQSCFIYAFEKWDGEADTLSSAYKISKIQKEIIENGFDSEICLKLIESVKNSDFDKTIYRVPIIYLIFEKLERNYSNYHEWKTIDNIYFQPNLEKFDFEKSNFDNLDAICSIINPDNYTQYQFIALGMDNANDSINYDLTVKRTNYIINYLVEKKGLHPRQVVVYRIPKKGPWNAYKLHYRELYQNLYRKRKAQILFKERHFKS